MKENASCNDVYAFPQSISLLLQKLPNVPNSGSAKIYTYGSWSELYAHDPVFQISIIIASLTKIAEVGTLWQIGGPLLAISSSAPWVFFLFAAAILEIRAISNMKRPLVQEGNTDLIMGFLPSVTQPGGPRKIILGITGFQTSPWMRILWSIAAPLLVSSLIMTYLLLNQQDSFVTFVWIGFQLFWQAVRVAIYHFAGPAISSDNRSLVERQWSSVSAEMRRRVLKLVLGTAEYQVYMHPRGETDKSYKEDCFSLSEISNMLISPVQWSKFPLPSTTTASASGMIDVHITTVIGDTVLSSAVWIMDGVGRESPMDLYDACVVVFQLTEHSKTVSIPIPAHRVLSAATLMYPDPQSSESPRFIPRGHQGRDHHTWIYWIPCESGEWLQIKSNDLKILGARKATILGDEDVTEILAAGNLNISLTHVDDVKAGVKLSKNAWNSLSRLSEHGI